MHIICDVIFCGYENVIKLMPLGPSLFFLLWITVKNFSLKLVLKVIALRKTAKIAKYHVHVEFESILAVVSLISYNYYLSELQSTAWLLFKVKWQKLIHLTICMIWTELELQIFRQIRKRKRRNNGKHTCKSTVLVWYTMYGWHVFPSSTYEKKFLSKMTVWYRTFSYTKFPLADSHRSFW